MKKKEDDLVHTHWERRLIKMAGEASGPTPYTAHSYWPDEKGQKEAYALCANIAAHHSKSFYLASGLLPEQKRSATRALYAFCRTVDDIVDEGTLFGRDVELDYWRGLVSGYLHPRPDDQVGQAWLDTLQRYGIPSIFALQLIDGVSQDLQSSTYQKFEDLATYCYGVASTVGLMSMYIVGFKSDEALRYAIKLGVALQMTNILRDVGEDFRMGRIYLPQDELNSFGITHEDLAKGNTDARWREFMKFQIFRTRLLYSEAWEGIKYLERDGQLAIGAASEFYRSILGAIEANDYDVFSKRASLSGWGKIKQIPSIWLKLSKQF